MSEAGGERTFGGAEVEQFEHADVILCPGGPKLVRGRQVVEDADGVPHLTTRPVTAVCRCGKSGSAPWCDGTHKLLPAAQRPS